MEHLKNKVLNYENRTIGNYNVEDYFTFNVGKIQGFIKDCSNDFFEYYQLNDDDKLERIALELYNNANYWDIVLLINDMDPLFSMVYNYDTISSMAEDKANKYLEDIGTSVPSSHADYLASKYEAIFNKENDSKRIIKIVKPNRMQDFLQLAREKGCLI